MDIQKGDQVLVNVAPFIGSSRRNGENIHCEVVDIWGDEIEVRTLSPFREFQLRVTRNWIEGKTNGQVCLSP